MLEQHDEQVRLAEVKGWNRFPMLAEFEQGR